MPQVEEACKHILLEGLLVVLESGTMLLDLTGVGYLGGVIFPLTLRFKLSQERWSSSLYYFINRPEKNLLKKNLNSLSHKH